MSRRRFWLGICVALAVLLSPVSYTQLDVYKRQLLAHMGDVSIHSETRLRSSEIRYRGNGEPFPPTVTCLLYTSIPRIGMEVLVTFLEGDPDQPLVTGCLYHAEHVVPYDLPANKTRSVFKTLSLSLIHI